MKKTSFPTAMKPVPCVICAKEFASRATWTRHLAVRHQQHADGSPLTPAETDRVKKRGRHQRKPTTVAAGAEQKPATASAADVEPSTSTDLPSLAPQPSLGSIADDLFISSSSESEGRRSPTPRVSRITRSGTSSPVPPAATAAKGKASDRWPAKNRPHPACPPIALGAAAADADPTARRPTKPLPVFTPSARPPTASAGSCTVTTITVKPTTSTVSTSAQTVAVAPPTAAAEETSLSARVLAAAVAERPTDTVAEIADQLAVVHRWTAAERDANQRRIADLRAGRDAFALELKACIPSARPPSDLKELISRIDRAAKSAVNHH